MPDQITVAPPTEPEFRRAQRARVTLYVGGDERFASCIGWARIDSDWLHLHDDAEGAWTSWPIRNVVSVEWRPGA